MVNGQWSIASAQAGSMYSCTQQAGHRGNAMPVVHGGRTGRRIYFQQVPKYEVSRSTYLPSLVFLLLYLPTFNRSTVLKYHYLPKYFPLRLPTYLPTHNNVYLSIYR